MGISLSFLNQLTPYSIILEKNNIILHQVDTQNMVVAHGMMVAHIPQKMIEDIDHLVDV